MKSKLEIYALSVCFSSVLILIVSISTAGYSFFEITAPELTMSSYQYEKYISNPEYKKSIRSCSKDDTSNDKELSDAEITQQRLDAFEVAKSAEKRSGYQSLIHSLLFLVVSTLTLFIHWFIARSARINP